MSAPHTDTSPEDTEAQAVKCESDPAVGRGDGEGRAIRSGPQQTTGSHDIEGHAATCTSDPATGDTVEGRGRP